VRVAGRACVVAMIVALAATVRTSAGDPSAADVASAARLQQLTQAFASLDVRDLNGRRWNAPSLRGRVVLVDFWATWCAPCLADIPWLRRAQQRFGPDRLAILGVSLDVGDRRTLTAWLNRNRVDWPQIWDHRGYDGDLARKFGVAALPQSLLVDASGRVVATNLRGERLVAAIAALLQ
jgi:thiol-disulfide isomerase/thioredoxin